MGRDMGYENMERDFPVDPEIVEADSLYTDQFYTGDRDSAAY